MVVGRWPSKWLDDGCGFENEFVVVGIQKTRILQTKSVAMKLRLYLIRQHFTIAALVRLMQHSSSSTAAAQIKKWHSAKKMAQSEKLGDPSWIIQLWNVHMKPNTGLSLLKWNMLIFYFSWTFVLYQKNVHMTKTFTSTWLHFWHSGESRDSRDHVHMKPNVVWPLALYPLFQERSTSPYWNETCWSFILAESSYHINRTFTWQKRSHQVGFTSDESWESRLQKFWSRIETGENFRNRSIRSQQFILLSHLRWFAVVYAAAVALAQIFHIL